MKYFSGSYAQGWGCLLCWSFSRRWRYYLNCLHKTICLYLCSLLCWRLKASLVMHVNFEEFFLLIIFCRKVIPLHGFWSWMIMHAHAYESLEIVKLFSSRVVIFLLIAGTYGLVDYTNYEDMKYAVSFLCTCSVYLNKLLVLFNLVHLMW